MPGELTVIEHQLKAVRPRLDLALGGIMPATRLEQTILVSCERTPILLSCTPQSILNAAMTFAVLGLPVDGATGQGFMIPFGKVAQAVIGYRGYNTLGARAGLTITAGHVREGDEFAFEKGTQAFVRHIPKLGSQGRIIAFWSCATANDRPPIVEVLGIDDVLAIKAKSAAVAAAVKSGRPTPWNDPEIGFPAMGEKSARRRLARSTPLRIDQPQFQLAARMEEAFDEQGKLAYIKPDCGVVVEGEPAYEALPHRNTETPTAESLLGPQESVGDIAVETTGRSISSHEPISKEIPDTAPTDSMVETFLTDHAQQGIGALQDAWKKLTPRQQHLWSKMKDLHFKPMAMEADKAHAP